MEPQLDDSYFKILSASCITCRHYEGGGECRAFPEGIPQLILHGENDHREPYPGDHNIQYKPIEL